MIPMVVKSKEPALLHFDTARRALAEARSVDEVKAIRDQAQAVAAYLRQQKQSLEMQNDAAEIKLRAERRLGEMLRETPKHEGGRPPETSATMSPVSPKLADLGITRKQSSRWQKEAQLPEYEFAAFVARARQAEEGELTTAGLLREVKDYNTVEINTTGAEQALLRARFARLRMSLHAILELDPVAVAESHGDGDRASVAAISLRLSGWFAEYERTVQGGIHEVRAV